MKKAILIITISLAGIALNAQINIDRDHFKQLIAQGKYDQMLEDAHNVRKQPYGKNCLVDYYIAKSLCGLGQPQNASVWFDYIFKHYKLTDGNVTFLTSEQSSCQGSSGSTAAIVPVLGMPDQSMLTAQFMPQASVSGKMGYMSDCNTPYEEPTSIREVTAAEFDSRLFPVNMGAEAIAKYRSILPADYNVDTSGRFILVTYNTMGFDNEDVKETARRLEKTYHFFSEYYNLRLPDKFIAVYLLPDKYTLRQTAEIVHGISIPSANIGYSIISDLSLLGVAGIGKIGTLCHELFHLMIRTDVGDVSPWMDEGIACIYETSTWNDSVLKGDLKNWRVAVLRDASDNYSNKIPKLKDFLNYNWKAFNGTESDDQCTAYINYAYGKEFMLYAQELGKLADLVTAFKNRNVMAFEDPLVMQQNTDVKLVESIFSTPIDQIEGAFLKWFSNNYSFALKRIN